jgi:hypothetical protein
VTKGFKLCKNWPNVLIWDTWTKTPETPLRGQQETSGIKSWEFIHRTPLGNLSSRDQVSPTWGDTGPLLTDLGHFHMPTSPGPKADLWTSPVQVNIKKHVISWHQVFPNSKHSYLWKSLIHIPPSSVTLIGQTPSLWLHLHFQATQTVWQQARCQKLLAETWLLGAKEVLSVRYLSQPVTPGASSIY